MKRGRRWRAWADHRNGVLTALAVVGQPLTPALARSVVQFAAFGAETLARYIARSGKAVAYAIEGRAAEFVERIDGLHSGIIGLLLFENAALLRAARGAF